MTAHTDPHLADLERQIAETREALGQTVEELAAKVDVPSRAKAKAKETAERLRAAEDRTRNRATQAAGSLKSRLPGGSSDADGAGPAAGSGAHRADVRAPAPGPLSAGAAASAGLAVGLALVWAMHRAEGS
jgi:hypothetical protein